MTIWDKIYKNYLKGGLAWATIEGKLLPQFVNFIKINKFAVKHALEIGCGLGKYLVFLKELGFKTDGVDSSQTAVKTTKTNLTDDSNIIDADMFEYKIPRNKYDLIFSIATVHHGLKPMVKKVIDEIYKSLVSGGKVFITLPDIESNRKWKTFINDKSLGNGTFAPVMGPEKGLPHSFYTKPEVKDLFGDFKKIKIKLDDHGKIVHGHWIITGEK
jgi:SAM-dependent methyltransferase